MAKCIHPGCDRNVRWSTPHEQSTGACWEHFKFYQSKKIVGAEVRFRGAGIYGTATADSLDLAIETAAALGVPHEMRDFERVAGRI